MKLNVLLVMMKSEEAEGELTYAMKAVVFVDSWADKVHVSLSNHGELD